MQGLSKQEIIDGLQKIQSLLEQDSIESIDAAVEELEIKLRITIGEPESYLEEFIGGSSAKIVEMLDFLQNVLPSTKWDTLACETETLSSKLANNVKAFEKEESKYREKLISKIKTLISELGKKIHQVVIELSEAEQQVGECCSSVEQGLSTFVESSKGVEAALESLANLFQSATKDFKEQTKAVVQEFEDAGAAVQEEFVQTISEAMDELVSFVDEAIVEEILSVAEDVRDELVESLRENVSEPLFALAEQAIDELVDILDEVEEALLGSEEEGRQESEQVNEKLDVLEPITDQMMSMYDSAKGLAPGVFP